MPYVKDPVDWEKELPKIKELGKMGLTLTAISKRYNVSPQRINQIVRRYIKDWDKEYGQAVRRQERQDARYSKWGVREDSELYVMKRKKFHGKKNNAARTGKHWDLEFGDIDWPTHCPILGIELDYFSEGRQENSVSFDQQEPGKGYVKGNVKVMSWRANRIKNDGTYEEHLKIAEYLKTL